MIFRTSPPHALVEQILRSLGIHGFGDLRWFSKDELRIGSQEEWLPLLEPYYLPCKAERFLHHGALDNQACITIIKHILKEHNYLLASVERTYNGKKQPLYQVRPTESTWSSLPNLNIEFT